LICKEFESTILCFPQLFLGGFNVLVLSSIKFMIFVNEYQILSLLFMHFNIFIIAHDFLVLVFPLVSFTYMLGLWILAKKVGNGSSGI
jgi:hypothetical protein